MARLHCVTSQYGRSIDAQEGEWGMVIHCPTPSSRKDLLPRVWQHSLDVSSLFLPGGISLIIRELRCSVISSQKSPCAITDEGHSLNIKSSLSSAGHLELVLVHSPCYWDCAHITQKLTFLFKFLFWVWNLWVIIIIIMRIIKIQLSCSRTNSK